MIRDATEADLPRILEITNRAVTETTAIWTVTPLTLEGRARWLAERQARGFPVIVGDTGSGVAGFASFGDFRPFDGYVHTVEHSVYVDPASHRCGIGRRLMEALIERARATDKHVMVGGIEAGNAASLALHRALGFIETGRMPEVGRKFGRWLDLVFVQKSL